MLHKVRGSLYVKMLKVEKKIEDTTDDGMKIMEKII